MWIKFVLDFEDFKAGTVALASDEKARQLCEDGIALATRPPIPVKKVVKEPVIKKAVKKSKK
jgi:hypothetical protein